jgi:hypothetical protein
LQIGQYRNTLPQFAAPSYDAALIRRQLARWNRNMPNGPPSFAGRNIPPLAIVYEDFAAGPQARSIELQRFSTCVPCPRSRLQPSSQACNGTGQRRN